MCPPAHHRAEVGQDRVVQEAHRAARHEGTDEDHDEGDDADFHPMRGQEGLRGLPGHQVDEATEVPDQPDVEDAVADGEDRGDGEDLAESADIVAQERPELSGRGVQFGIGLIGIDEVFEEAEHGGRPGVGCSDGVTRCLSGDRHDGIGRLRRAEMRSRVPCWSPSLGAPCVAESRRIVTPLSAGRPCRG